MDIEDGEKNAYLLTLGVAFCFAHINHFAVAWRNEQLFIEWGDAFRVAEKICYEGREDEKRNGEKRTRGHSGDEGAEDHEDTNVAEPLSRNFHGLDRLR